MSNWTAITNLVILTLTLLCLVYYAWETHQIKRASLEQVEAQQAPCLVPDSAPRDPDAAVLQLDGITGGTVIKPTQGRILFLNIGPGPAVNVRYRLFQVDTAVAMPATSEDYLPAVAAQGSLLTHLPHQILQVHKHRLEIGYESVKGTLYSTEVTIEASVLTDMTFARGKIA